MFKKNDKTNVETNANETPQKVGFVKRNRRIIKAAAATAVFVTGALYACHKLNDETPSDDQNNE